MFGTFCGFVNGLNTYLNQGNSVGASNAAITLERALCASVTSAILLQPEAAALVPYACGPAGVILTQAITQACTISDGTNSIYDSIVGFYDPVEVFVLAGIVGGETSLPVEIDKSTVIGGYPPTTIELNCPEVDHVIITPATATIPIGQFVPLVARAYNTDLPSQVIKSSSMNFMWDATQASGIASVLSYFSTSGVNSVADIQGVAAGGPVPITATETTSGKTATSPSQITVTSEVTFAVTGTFPPTITGTVFSFAPGSTITIDTSTGLVTASNITITVTGDLFTLANLTISNPNEIFWANSAAYGSLLVQPLTSSSSFKGFTSGGGVLAEYIPDIAPAYDSTNTTFTPLP